MTPDTALAPGTVISGRYKLHGLIAAGGMGEVYQGEDLEEPGPIAIKMIRLELSRDQDLVARIQREATALSKLGHPNIVRVFDFGHTDDGRFYFVMELLAGLDLHELIRAQGPLPYARVMGIAAQVAGAVAAAHRHSIIHRDLKPENVMVLEGDRVKVVDFGAAKDVRPEAPGIKTAIGEVWGTPEYMAPEQAAGQPVDARTDIYALALMMYEMLVGVPPFQHEDPAAVQMMQITHSPPPFPEAVKVPLALRSLISQMLQKKGRQRPASMDEVIARLDV